MPCSTHSSRGQCGHPRCTANIFLSYLNTNNLYVVERKFVPLPLLFLTLWHAGHDLRLCLLITPPHQTLTPTHHPLPMTMSTQLLVFSSGGLSIPPCPHHHPLPMKTSNCVLIFGGGGLTTIHNQWKWAHWCLFLLVVGSASRYTATPGPPRILYNKCRL